MIKTKIIICIIIISVIFNGCGMAGFDPEYLMKPPKAVGNQSEIQKILEKNANGAEVVLKYPRSGEYRSSIIMRDMNGDQIEEAIVFYSLNEETAINFMILSQIGIGWKEIGNFKGEGNEIEEVIFLDINRDKTEEFMVGWSTLGSRDKNLTIHEFDFKNTETKFATILDNYIYSNVVVGQFKEDELQSIMTIKNTNNTENPYEVCLLSYNDHKIKQINSVYLEKEIVELDNVQAGYINDAIYGMVIDASYGTDSLITQIVYFDSDKNKIIISEMYDIENETIFFTKRPEDTVFSKDINQDRIIEIPFLTEFRGFELRDEREKLYLTTWKKYEPNGNHLFQDILSMYMNNDDGFYFTFPEDWLEDAEVTVNYDSRTHKTTFYMLVDIDIDQEFETIKKPLLEVCVFSSEDEYKNSGYQKIIEKNSKIYAVKIPEDQNEHSISKAEVENYLRLITDL